MAGNFSCMQAGETALVITQTFDAPREEVFAAWSDPRELAQWWDPTGKPLTICEIDLRVGGKFRWVNQGEARHTFAGVYREIAPPEKIVFEAGVPGALPTAQSTLLFVETANKTTLTMTIRCQSAEQRAAMLAMRVDQGTKQTLQNLADHLARKRT